MRAIITAMVACALLVLQGAAQADEQLPQVSHDGLHLLKGTKVRAVYMKPGADLKEYNKIALLDTYVAFRKNWQRDHNRDAVGLADRVSDKDMQRIRQELAAEFRKVFTKELSEKGGHEVVTTAGSGVLILRPAIINLDVTAPDLMEPGITRTFAADAGQMTLYLELYDGKTQDIIARVIDPEVVGDDLVHVTNSVTNRADVDRLLRRWADLLNAQLAAVKPAQ
ncbi:MAG: hypothetical protein CME59_09305 [Halioglobus sp.]|nr:hypothetical protein [Halioglobus sp.]|tara:strand:+ start:1438 stop:2109 length:672 start_codon:yes stop_codon:yes gene_type:complete